MALNFLEALDSARRRSTLVNQPGVEKSQFDKMLRDNALRRLSNRGTPATPTSPFLDEVVRNAGGEGPMTPAGFDPTTGTTPSIQGTTDPAQMAINAGKMGLPTVSPEDGIKGYLQALSFPLSIMNPQTYIPKLTWNMIKPDNPEAAKQGLEFSLDTTPVTNPMTGLPAGFTSTGTPAQGVTVNPSPATTVNSGILGTEAEGQAAEAGGAAAFGKVLCTELYRQGKMPWYIYHGDSIYGRSMDYETMLGYHVWAVPLAKKMSESPLLTAILRPLIMSWAKEMSYRVGNRTTGNLLGKILSFVGEPICRFIGRSLKCQSIRISQTL